MTTPLRPRVWLLASVSAFVIAAIVLPFAGSAPLDLGAVWRGQEPDWSILMTLRVSRTLLGLFAGGALALAGSLSRVHAPMLNSVAFFPMNRVKLGASFPKLVE